MGNGEMMSNDNKLKFVDQTYSVLKGKHRVNNIIRHKFNDYDVVYENSMWMFLYVYF